MKSPESEALRSTSKGRLQYDPFWHITDISGTLEQCTKPPLVRKIAFLSKTVIEPRRSVEFDKDTNKLVVSLAFSPEAKKNSTPAKIEYKSDIPRKKTNAILVSIQKEQKPKAPKKKDISAVAPAKKNRNVVVDHTHTVALVKANKEIEEKKRNAIEKKRREFEYGSHWAQVNAEQQWSEVSAYQEKEQEQSHLELEAEIKTWEVQTEQYLRHKAELNVYRKQIQDAQLQEARLQSEIIEKKLNNEIEQKVNSMKAAEMELKKLKEYVEHIISACPFSDAIPASTKKAGDLLTDIINKVQKIINMTHSTPEVAAANLNDILRLALEVQKVVDLVQKNVQLANQRGKEAQAKAEEAEKVKQAAEKQAAETKALSTPVQVSDSTPICTPEDLQNDLVCSPQAFLEYQRLQTLAITVEQAYQSLITDPQHKKYKFTLQKAVTTPVNAISPNSGAHLRDKLQRICKLLSGQAVDVGGQAVSASQHPAGVIFCKQLFAKKIVKQGDDQVSSNHDSAFAIAAVTVGVMTQFPDVTDLLLAEFHLKCPFLVPYYVQKQDGQSMDDYLKTLGYNFQDGTVEKQDKYLRRMTGIMRLYAAILVSMPPQGPSHPHPHGMDKGWMWMTQLLNLYPRPDITATMLHDFLQVTGSTFIKMYKKQFVKLLRAVREQFIPKVQAVTKAGSGGPVVRLQSYMEKCIASGTAPLPEGMLPNNFWYT